MQHPTLLTVRCSGTAEYLLVRDSHGERGGVREVQRDPSVVTAERAVPGPQHLTRRRQFVQHRRDVAAHAGRQHQGFHRRGRENGTGQLLDSAQQPVDAAGRPGLRSANSHRYRHEKIRCPPWHFQELMEQYRSTRAGNARVPRPAPVPPRPAAQPGNDDAAAAVLRHQRTRGCRRPPPTPLCLIRPHQQEDPAAGTPPRRPDRTRRVCATHRSPPPRRGRTAPPARAERTARGSARNDRASRPSGSATGSSNDGAIPGGKAVPSASRSTGASAGSAHLSIPATRTTIARRAASSCSSAAPASTSTERATTSATVKGPRMRSRSAISSMLRARRFSLRRCRSASVVKRA